MLRKARWTRRPIAASWFGGRYGGGSFESAVPSRRPDRADVGRASPPRVLPAGTPGFERPRPVHGPDIGDRSGGRAPMRRAERGVKIRPQIKAAPGFGAAIRSARALAAVRAGAPSVDTGTHERALPERFGQGAFEIYCG
ncbi:hypothetical protein MUNTM_58640 [Mycobacterium sp. MUNTM1]